MNMFPSILAPGKATKAGQIALANAAAFDGAFLSTPLMDYIAGPVGDIATLEQLLEAIAPAVQTSRKFEFRVNNTDTGFLAMEQDEDVRALGSEFKRLRAPGASQVSKTLSKGLTYLLDQDELEDEPMAEERAAARLKAILLRTEIIRATKALSDAADNKAVTWTPGGSATDPDADLLDAVIAGGDDAGLNPNRLLIGSTAWQRRLRYLRGQNTAGGFAGAGMTPAELAQYLSIERAIVSMERYNLAKTKGKGQLVSADVALLYNAREGLGKDDPSNIKRFWSPMAGGQGEWAVYRREVATGALVEITVAHRSQIVVTSDAGIRKLTVS